MVQRHIKAYIVLKHFTKAFRVRVVTPVGKSGPGGSRDHDTDWLSLENALPRTSLPRRRIER
jgi:hypothetical protein